MNSLARSSKARFSLFAMCTLACSCGPGPNKPEVLPPTITAEPADQSVEEGQAATFAVQASGTEPLAYQWQILEGATWTDVEGADQPTVQTPPATFAHHGRQYRCRVTNEKGEATSQTATLTVVRRPPVITTQPTDQTVAYGEVATFTAAATGAGTLTYQWQWLDEAAWTDLTGANQASYETPPATLADHAKQFRLVVTNEGGSTVSEVVSLTVILAAPVITTHPADQTVVEGDAATFTVAATGSGTLRYQWQILEGATWTDLTDATQVSFVTHPTTLADDGAQLRCVVSSEGGSGTSNAARLTVTPAPPVILGPPASHTVQEGEEAVFTVEASGSGTLAYQWQWLEGSTWTDIPDATQVSYALPKVGLADDGLELRCRVSNAGGSVTSSSATLTVTMALPVITLHPADQTVGEGGQATFAVAATGSGTLSYQWQWLDGGTWTDIADATDLEYQTPAALLADNGKLLRCQVTNEAGSVVSSAANLFVDMLLPVITAHPTNQTVDEGGVASFSVAATGSGTLTYQWQWLDGAAWTDLTGATAALHQTPPATLADDGRQLRCVVSNAAGGTPSAAATLTVNRLPPVITTPPASTAVDEGSAASFSVVASGSGTLTYQWQWLDGAVWTDLGGADQPSYQTPPTTLAEDGRQLRCVVTNEAGSTPSAAATLTVSMLPPVITTHPTSTAVVASQTAHFSVTATGSGTLAYQWQWLDGAVWTDLGGATLASYETPPTTLADHGLQLRCVVSNEAGPTPSDAAVLSVAAWDGVWKVDAAAPPGGDGLDWTTAFVDLQAALATASEGEEIWVAAGSYSPGAAREDSFVLKAGLRLYGGFLGVETSRDERDPDTQVTTLSGDIGVSGDPSDNSHHVVTGAANATLDGFRITAGNALGAALELGGGLLVDQEANMTVSGCRFEGNLADQGGALALYLPGGPTTVERCVFVDNTATNSGGAIAQHDSPALIRSCEFQGNRIDLGASNPQFGGALYSGGALSTGSVVSCTFTENLAPAGGGTIHNQAAQTLVANVILWGNTAPGGELTATDGGASFMTYSLVQGGHAGAGNLDADPRFTDPVAGDLTLQPCSPCLDAADGDLAPPTDLLGLPRLDDASVEDSGVGAVNGITWADMGAHERATSSGGPFACRHALSCAEVLQRIPAAPTGPYWLDPEQDGVGFRTWCDMTNEGGGWTLVLLNSGYATPPKPFWDQLVNACNVSGNVEGNLASGFDLFLGVKYWSQLGTTLRAETGANPSAILRRALYDFSLDAGANYTLHLTNPRLLIGTEQSGLFTFHNHLPLSSRDRDNDTYGLSCANAYGNTAWWYGNCWSGSFWGGGGAPSFENAPYWTGQSTASAWGALWVR